MKQRLSQAAFDLIIRYETGERAFYEKFLKHPSWPGGASGVTIGAGYDLAHDVSLDRDWGQFLKPDELTRLHRCIGKSGQRARQALSGVRDITIEWEWAMEVFNECTLPKYIRQTVATYPTAADKLPADAFGALASLVFNRGTDLQGERRQEMREIQILLAADDRWLSQRDLVKSIAAKFRSMKRLWRDSPDSDGDLVDRRESEARLIEQSAS